MKKYGKFIIAAAAFVVFMAVVSAAYTKLSKEYQPGQNLVARGESAETPAQESSDAVEKEPVMAVDFTVEDAAGEQMNLLSFVGKPIVLNFWASWCGPCKSELPDFQAAYESYDGEIEFVMVNMTDGSRETKEIATEFWTGEGYTLPILYDTTQEAAYTYGVSSLPTTYFINAKGEIVAWAQGMIDAETLELGISMIQ